MEEYSPVPQKNKSSTFSSRNIDSREENNDTNLRGKPRGFEKVLDKFNLLKFLGIIGFEIAFIMTSLLLFFGTLNYFNIFPVSDTFPKYFGWLPRKDVPNGTSRKTQTNAPVNSPKQNSIPFPLPTSSSFNYDVKKAETFLTQYIKENIKPEFLPTKIEVNQGQQIDGNPGRIKNEFGSKFILSNTTFFANFHYMENTNNSHDFTIFIQPNNINETNLTASLSNSLLSTYFNNPEAASACTAKETMSICNIVKTNINEKKEFGAFFGKDKGKLIPIVFTCSIAKESKEYNTYKSCINF